MNFSIGDIVGGYEIVGILGSGGMGEVYRVRNVISDRVDAMKVLLAGLQRDQDFATRFLREIKVQARLVHPNIAQLYTAFEHQGNLIMILELVEGMSLVEMLRRGRIPLSSAVDYASQALSALSYAHQQGVVHRDIKPGNIMVTRAGAVKLMDFGIAKANTDHSLTVTGNLIGSLYYMSPEQVRAEPLDNRSDLYSLGIVLYQMATGRKPFDGDSEYSIMRAQIEQQPPPPRTVDPAVPEELNGIILRALSKKREHRYQSGEEFRQALEQVAALLREGSPDPARRPRGPRAAGGVRHHEQAIAPLRETAPEQPSTYEDLARSGKRTESPPAGGPKIPAPPREDHQPLPPPLVSARAAHEPENPISAPPRVGLWVAAGVAAAVLVVASTQMSDWIATESPGDAGGSVQAPVDLQMPADAATEKPSPQPPPAAGSPPAATAQTSAAATRGATPKRTSVAAPSAALDTPSQPASRVAPEKSSPAPPPKSEITSVAAGAAAAPSTDAAPESVAAAAPDRGQAPAPTPVAPRVAFGDRPPSPSPMTIPTQNERPQQPAPVAAVPSAAPAPERAADRVYSLGEVDDPPRALTRVQASYTEATAKARVQGAVLLECVVWPDGRAHSIEVVKSIGHSELDRNAMQALEKWRFVPARKDGVPVKVRLRIEHAFNPPSLRGAPSLTKDR